MPKPMAICIEDTESPTPEARYLRCVAVPGRGPGLRVDGAGTVIWKREDGVACELWVSADERLILYRPEAAPPVTVSRAGRSLDVPCSKPVVLVDQDEVEIGGRHLRVHIHGVAQAIAAPAPLAPARRNPLQKGIAAAAMLGAMAISVGCKEIEVRLTPPVPLPPSSPTLDVRETPPEPEMPSETPTIEVRDQPPTATPSPLPEEVQVANAVQGAWLVEQAYEVNGEQQWITGTLTIEEGTYGFVPAEEAPGSSMTGTLDFLVNEPQGRVEISLGVWEGADFRAYPEGTILGTCTFGNSPAVFEIRIGEPGTLAMVEQGYTNELWRISRQP